MSENTPLEPSLAAEVLVYLGVSSSETTHNQLEKLIAAYTRKVPWESASRIARAAKIPDAQRRARWPHEFWRDAIQMGSGGTCFESNHAFASLLWALGFDAYLTINNMEEKRACHTAIIVHTDGRRFLVDAGFPLYTLIPVKNGRSTHSRGVFHNYTLSPLEKDSYIVRRDRHPSPYAFTLIDRPVAMQEYRMATVHDYGPNGRFLERVIITRVVNEQVWRFDSAERPYCLQEFQNGQRIDQTLPANPAPILAQHFEMNLDLISTALHNVSAA